MLDGGDVLKHGGIVCVGQSARSNAHGIRQLAEYLAPLGARVVVVPLTKALHLKSAVTALPDGTVIGYPPVVDDPSIFGDFLPVREEPGAHVAVPIYYESRLAKLKLDDAKKPKLDAEFEEATEGEETEHKEKLKTKWAALEALVGAEERIELIAVDIVKHWESRIQAMDGKAMIVCMDRRICIDLYNAVVGCARLARSGR